MSKRKLFLLSLVLTTVVWLVIHYVQRPRESPLALVRIADGLFLTAQLKTENVPALRKRGVRTIVDMRPDGEAADQPSSAAIEYAAKASGMNFHYNPVPHESIPDSAVDALSEVLSTDALPAVLYCRTGRRAVRLFALEEASRVDGPSTDAIMKMVRAAGFSADDLNDAINLRLSRRSSAHPVNH